MCFQDYSDSFGGLDNEYLFTALNSNICEHKKKNISSIQSVNDGFHCIFFPEPIDFVY